MAEINPPAWMQAGSYPARTDRLILSSLLSYPGFAVDEPTPTRIRQGIKPSYQNYQLKARAAPTPNMTVIVSAGFCFIDNHDSGGLGTYVCVNDADRTLTVQPAGGAGQYRRDCVVASVYDQETAGAVSEWRLEVIQGTYAASAGAAVRPSLPPNCSLIADLTIGPAQASVAAGQIFDSRNFSVAAGGVLPVSSSVMPTRLHPGQMLYLTDLDELVVGQLAGTNRRVREQLRPLLSNQAAVAPLNTTGTYVDFTSVAWAPVVVTVPPSGMVRVTISANVENSTSSTAATWATWRASGAATISASVSSSVIVANGRSSASRSRLITELTPGQSLTITPQWYISSGSSATAAVNSGNLEVQPIA
ncbi:hypothetical protein ACH4K8_20580 [Streptomyces anulatus]